MTEEVMVSADAVSQDIVDAHLRDKGKNYLDLNNLLDAPIFRVFSVERLLQTFTEKKLTLVKPSRWEDPFENMVFNSTAITDEGVRIHFDSMRKSMYGQCWTLNQEESDFLWRIYARESRGVRAKCTVRRLFDAFFKPAENFALISYFIGKVSYDSAANLKRHFEDPEILSSYVFDTSGKGHVRTLLWKRLEFEYEHEIRLIYRANDKYYDTNEPLFRFDVDPTALFDELLFDPRLKVEEFRVYEEELHKLGFNKPIGRSTLYELPNLVLRLKV